jgi:hypothetical protein
MKLILSTKYLNLGRMYETIPVAMLSNVLVWSRLIAGIAVSNPTASMDVCFLSLLRIV